MNIVSTCQRLTIFFLLFLQTESACTFPTELDGVWYDSNFNSEITISRSHLQINPGWSYSAYSSTLTVFTCIESDDSTWLFKSQSTVDIFTTPYYGLTCVNYKKITDFSYMYYLNLDEEANANSKRIRFIEKASYDTGNVTSISDICIPTSGPGTEEFHVLVKKGNVADVKQFFPNALLGVYAYSIDGSTTVCGADSVWDDCTDRTTMTFNYTQCNTNMFGSSSGVLYSTYSVTSGSNSYVIIINGDSNPSNIFTCLAVSGTSASSNSGSCIKQQSPTTKTADGASVLITLTAYELCPFTTDTAASSSSSIGIIIGVVIVLLLIIAIIVGFLIYYKRKHKRFPCQKNKVENGNNEKAGKPEKAEKTPPGDAVSPRSAIDIDIPAERKKLQPLQNPPLSEVNENPPLSEITRQ